MQFFKGSSSGSRGASQKRLYNSSKDLVVGCRRLSKKKMHIFLKDLEVSYRSVSGKN